jgi:DNA-binding HxlR family transcriptional regulator
VQLRPKEESGIRAGTQALSLLALPLNAALMQALAENAKPLADLRRELDSPPQTTLRAYLRVLTQTGVVEKRRCNDFPGNVEYQLADAGRELLVVADILAAWLGTFPQTPTSLGSGGARSAIKALVEGWSTNMVRALAARPLSLTELDSIIATVSYPSLERRLGAMRHDGLVRPLTPQGRGTPYAVSDWLRKAIAPLAAAARWEVRRLGGDSPLPTERDAEAAFLLALPLLRLPDELSGNCRLVVQVDAGDRKLHAGVVASIRHGRVEACNTTLDRPADGWAVGPVAAWFAAVLECDLTGLAIGGDPRLPSAVVEALSETLLEAPVES